MTMIKGITGSAVLLAALSLPLQAAEPVKVGSKIDTEGALLGNIILQVLESHGVKTVNKVQLGTTPVVRGAITSGGLANAGTGQQHLDHRGAQRYRREKQAHLA